MLYLCMPNASPSWHREGAAYGRTGTSPCPDIMSLGQTETPNSLDLPAYGRTETSTSPDLLAYGRTKTSNSPDLAAYGRTDTSNSPDLPAYGRTVKQTYVRPAGPPCLWPDRPPALELTKLLNGGKGCSRRKHGYRKESGSRALLAFPLPLALYARVLSKPG